MPPAGHLFVCHADLTRLACDAVVVPCDAEAMLRAEWERFVPERTEQLWSGWVQLHSAGLRDGHAQLIGRHGTVTQLVDTADFTDVDALVERVVEAVRRAAGRATPGGRRQLPLVGLPLAGTGAGGLAHRRGRVIELLLPALESLVAAEPFDVALVLFDSRDHAAVQGRRDRSVGWDEVGAHLADADRLGRLAAAGGLSLFVGSGVSVPLGLPSWRELLHELDPGRDVSPDDDLLAVAEEIVTRMEPTDYQRRMVEIFDRQQHTLGHALLAGLGVRQMVTTNYDPCLELALDRILEPEGFRVMTRSLPVGDKPWLLKLHGDIARPDRLVLTASDYRRLAREHGPLHGVVESLMLTSHLLFVGFGLSDDDYVAMARQVAVTRAEAEFSGAAPSVGTALTLTPDVGSRAHLDGLTVLTMDQDVDGAAVRRAARRVEILLDRVLMQATRAGVGGTSSFLDPRFAEAFATDADVSLRRRLLALAADRATVGSAGRRAVDQMLVELGLDREALASASSERP